jgi:hypothetical protein
MSDNHALLDALAAQQIRERVARNQQPRLPGPRRPPGRHALALRLHLLAEKLES